MLSCFFMLAMNAQNLQIHGKINDRQQQPVGYVSVALLAADSTTLVTGTITNDNGEFSLPGIHPGKYFISISYIGYQPQKQELNVTSNQTLSFVLEEDDYLLGEVEVTANRSSTVRQTAMQKTFMLSAAAIKKKDILDALQEIPNLEIDMNTRKISLADGSKPLILVNGIRRDGGLSSISPEDILSVDVVPTSSAEFMQQGYTSVINIKVKKSDKSYTTFNGGINTHPLVLFGIGDASLEFGNSNYSLYFSGQSFAFINNKSNMEERTETQSSIRHSKYKRKAEYWDSNFAIGGSRSWSDTDYSSFNASINYIPQSSDAEGTTTLTNRNPNEVNDYLYMREFDDKLWTGSLNFYHKHSFTTSNLEFLLSLNISDNKNCADQIETGEANEILSNYNFHNKRMSGYFTPSYEFMLGGLNSKIGLHTYYQHNKIVRNEGQKSEFAHKEWSEYVFLDVNKAWEKFSFAASAGLDVVFRDVEGHTDRYFNFRPVVNLGYKFNNHHALNLSYSMQATSPDVVQLNPYNTSSDTLSISTGNPYLKPYRTHRLRLGYTLTTKSFYAEPYVSYRRIDDAIVATGSTNSDGQYVQSLANQEYSDLWTVGAILRYSIPNIGFIGFNLAHNTIRFPEISQKDSYFTGRVNWGLTLNKFSFTGYYGLPTHVYAKYRHNYSTPESNCSLSYSVSSRLDVSAGMRFIFSKKRVEQDVEMPGYTYHYENRFTNRGNIVMLGIRFKFDDKRQQKKKENKIPESRDRGFRLINE